jgi:hypothetical protein
MKLACYADDPREPDLIGEAEVDLTEVLTKGETDGKNLCLTANSYLTPIRMVYIIQQRQICGKGLFGVDILVQCSSVRPVGIELL